MTCRILLLVALSLPGASNAHNGAVAASTPVRDIVVDGDFSDWPDHLPRHPIARAVYGNAPTSSQDLQAWFQVGHDSAMAAVYLAIEVRDESVVTEPLGGTKAWDTQDGVEVYLGLEHAQERVPVQSFLWGASAGLQADDDIGALGRVQHGDGWHRYEWRLPLKEQAQATVAFDVAVQDRDADGSFSWVAWGLGTHKIGSIERTGDLVLDTSPALGTIRGRLQRQKDGQGYGHAMVRVASESDSALQVTVESGPQGHFEAHVPPGTYRLWARAHAVTDTARVEVSGHRTADVAVSLRPATGRRWPAGPGVAVEARSGTRARQRHSFYGPDGLRRSAVNCLAQDGDGYLWIGGSEGVSRFDGGTFVHYAESDRFPVANVRAILPTGDGIWMATAAGLFRYDGSHVIRYGMADGLPSDWTTALAITPSGDLWVGTSRGPSCFSDGYFTNYGEDSGIARSDVGALCVDESQRAWVSTYAGVYVLDGQQFRRVAQRHTDATNSAMALDGGGNLWVGIGESLRQMDADGRELLSLEAGGLVQAVLVDSQNRVWAAASQLFAPGLATSRLLELVEGELVEVEPGGLPGGQIRTITQDREGGIWIGGPGHISRYDAQMRFTTAADGLPSDVVMTLLDDGAGDVWAGTTRGLARSAGEEYLPVAFRDDSARAFQVQHLAQDDRGRLWVGTSSGLFVGDARGHGRVTAHGSPPPEAHITALYAQGSAVWVGTNERLYRLGDRPRRFGTESGLPSSMISRLAEDGDGRLWVGTVSGLGIHDDGRFSTPEALKQVQTTITALAWHDDLMWLGTPEGLYRHDGRSERPPVVLGGLSSDYINSIRPDAHGRVWICTRSGLFLYRAGVLQQWWDAMEGITSISDAVVDRQGWVHVGTMGAGVVRYLPIASAPAAFVDGVITTHRLPSSDQVEITTSQAFLAFDVRGVSLKTKPGGLRYRYRLSGHHDWRMTAARRIEYADLDVGEYLFEVQAVDRDLGMTRDPARVAVVVSYPYGEMALWCVLALTGLGLALQTVRIVRRNRKLTAAGLRLETSLQTEHVAREQAEILRTKADAANRAKSIFLANMSHEVRTPMNAILGFATIMDGMVTEPALKGHIASMQTAGKSLLGLIDDILGLAKLEAGTLELEAAPTDCRDLLREMETAFSPRLSQKGIGLQIEVDRFLPPGLVLDGNRLRQVLVHLIGNAVKFTEEGYVRVVARNAAPRNEAVKLELLVEDTGIGIPPDEHGRIFGTFEQRDGQSTRQYGGTGLGLAITRRLVEAMGGGISVASTVGEGSTFRVVLPDVEVAVGLTETEASDADVDALALEPAAMLPTADGRPDSHAEAPPAVAAMDSAVRERLPKLARELTLRRDTWEEISSTLPISEAEEFAVAMRQLGEEYGYPSLVAWGERLSSDVESFDMEAMEATLKSYPEMIDEIESLTDP